jgi:hypothetical protein
VYLSGVASLGIVQLGIALPEGGFMVRTPDVFVVFSRLGELPKGRALRVLV